MDATGRQFGTWLVQAAITALAYFVLGKLSLLLAIPPAYASPIWPAAGAAIASVAIFGYRMWPAIVLGAFSVNIAAAFDDSTAASVALSVGMTVLSAGAAVAQAVVGAPEKDRSTAARSSTGDAASAGAAWALPNAGTVALEESAAGACVAFTGTGTATAGGEEEGCAVLDDGAT